jgi:hypothetical protein
MVEVDGALAQMLLGPGKAPPRPIRVPFIFGTRGPKGEAVARERGGGVFSVVPTPGFAWSALLTMGTVLLHRAYKYRSVPGLDLAKLTGGPEWWAAIVIYPGAYHCFDVEGQRLEVLPHVGNDSRPGGRGATVSYQAEAAAGAFRQVESFLGAHLAR